LQQHCVWLSSYSTALVLKKHFELELISGALWLSSGALWLISGALWFSSRLWLNSGAFWLSSGAILNDFDHMPSTRPILNIYSDITERLN